MNRLEYLNIVDDNYKKILGLLDKKYLVKVELLSVYEKAFQSLVGEILKDASGELSINLEQITRRTCNISFYNNENAFEIDENNPFWMNKKFKLYLGVTNDVDTYWFEQGVFFANNVQNQDEVFTISGIDKGGAIDGSLNTNNVDDAQYIIEVGSDVYKVVYDTMSLSFNLPCGTQSVVDVIPPLVDFYYKDIKVESEISLDSNAPIGDLIKSLADGYGAETYYNTSGRLIFKRNYSDTLSNKYDYTPVEWRYIDDEGLYSDLNLSYEYSAKNTITVYTNSTEFENVSYTAYNDNPCSPIRVSLVGIRRADSVEIPYVEENTNRMLQRCKEYAEYLLTQETFDGLKATFSSILIPHMDVGKAISINDKKSGIKDNKFIISSLSMPLDESNMTVNATQVDFLTSK